MVIFYYDIYFTLNLKQNYINWAIIFVSMNPKASVLNVTSSKNAIYIYVYINIYTEKTLFYKQVYNDKYKIVENSVLYLSYHKLCPNIHTLAAGTHIQR